MAAAAAAAAGGLGDDVDTRAQHGVGRSDPDRGLWLYRSRGSGAGMGRWMASDGGGGRPDDSDSCPPSRSQDAWRSLDEHGGPCAPLVGSFQKLKMVNANYVICN